MPDLTFNFIVMSFDEVTGAIVNLTGNRFVDWHCLQHFLKPVSSIYRKQEDFSPPSETPILARLTASFGLLSSAVVFRPYLAFL